MTKRISHRLAGLSVSHLADACLRAETAMRVVTGLHPIAPGLRASGRAVPVRHYGSVDIFLEALAAAESGDVLVVDNEGRGDEGCIGDLVTLEVAQAGLSGIVIFGRHRDSATVRTIPIALFSLGACARGPVRLDQRDAQAFSQARIGGAIVTSDDWVVADDDGVIFVAQEAIEDVVGAAEFIRATELRQSALMNRGTTLREQLRFADYLRDRDKDPTLDFRAHLRVLDAAIEE